MVNSLHLPTQNSRGTSYLLESSLYKVCVGTVSYARARNNLGTLGRGQLYLIKLVLDGKVNVNVMYHMPAKCLL